MASDVAKKAQETMPGSLDEAWDKTKDMASAVKESMPGSIHEAWDKTKDVTKSGMEYIQEKSE
jgi:hypothetical protein